MAPDPITAPSAFLLSMLACDDPYLQADAARLLGELGDATAVDPLVSYVNACRSYAKTAGFEALARIGDRRAAGGIRHLVDHPNVFDDWFWHGCQSVRATAALALLTLGEGHGTGYLLELANKQSDVFFAWFAPAILRLPESAAAERLKRRLTSAAILQKGSRWTDPSRTVPAAEALGLIGDAAAIGRLLELLDSRSRYVRGQAALSLLPLARRESTSTQHRKRICDGVERVARHDAAAFARAQASLALCLEGDTSHAEGIVAVVETAAKQDDPFDCAAALEALGRAGLRQHAGVALAQLTHKDAYVRLCAVECLERLNAGASAALVPGNDPDPRVRMQVAKYQAARASRLTTAVVDLAAAEGVSR